MPYTKSLVCFANSRKYGMHCIAGKEIDDQGNKKWIRPVSNLPSGELKHCDICYSNGEEPRPLDFLQIIFEKHAPQLYQSENHIIVRNMKWTRYGRIDEDCLSLFTDSVDTLWSNGFNTRSGYNDKVPAEMSRNYNYSLALIEPSDVTFVVSFEEMRKRMRALFKYNNKVYKIIVTDPDFERRYNEEGEYFYNKKVYFCVSLSLPFIDKYCYKLVAGVIGKQ